MTETEAKEIFIKGPAFKLEDGKPYTLEQIITMSSDLWKEFNEAKGYLSGLSDGRREGEGLADRLNDSIQMCPCTATDSCEPCKKDKKVLAKWNKDK